LAKRKPEFEIRFEKPFLHEISVDKLSSMDSFGSARQKACLNNFLKIFSFLAQKKAFNFIFNFWTPYWCN